MPEFLPERLATVQVAEVAGWLYEYQYNDDAPVDLMRKKPDSQLYADVLTRARSIESLDDDDLRSLRYMVPGAVHGTRPCCGQGSDGVGGTAAALQWSSRSLGRRRHMLGTCCKLMLLLVCCAPICRPCSYRTQLPLTEARAGKVARRQNGRPEEQRVVTALHPGRLQNRKRAALAQHQAGQQQLGEQQVGQQQAAAGDPFPTLAKKGKPTNKVRGKHMGRLACAGAAQHPNAAGIVHLY